MSLLMEQNDVEVLKSYFSFLCYNIECQKLKMLDFSFSILQSFKSACFKVKELLPLYCKEYKKGDIRLI